MKSLIIPKGQSESVNLRKTRQHNDKKKEKNGQTTIPTLKLYTFELCNLNNIVNLLMVNSSSDYCTFENNVGENSWYNFFPHSL